MRNDGDSRSLTEVLFLERSIHGKRLGTLLHHRESLVTYLAWCAWTYILSSPGIDVAVYSSGSRLWLTSSIGRWM